MAHTEAQFLAAVDALVAIEAKRDIVPADFHGVAVGVLHRTGQDAAPLAVALEAEWEAGNAVAEHWDAIGKAEWKGEA